jgi:hypothetical protein
MSQCLSDHLAAAVKIVDAEMPVARSYSAACGLFSFPLPMSTKSYWGTPSLVSCGMFDIEKTIGIFRQGALDFDCKRMVLAQRKTGGERFEGQGFIRQLTDGTLISKIYVTEHNVKPFRDLETELGIQSGELYSDDVLYDLDATAHDGTRWTATRILPEFRWADSGMSVSVNSQMQSITAHLDLRQPQYYLRLHFFEEYEVPLNRMSEIEKDGDRWMVRDRAEFEACGSKFEVRKRDGSGDTIIRAVSEIPLPAAFSLRIQEALQYITAKSAIWRVRLEREGEELLLELASPWRKSPRTQFNPPISPVSIYFHQHGWRLFQKYLVYVVENTEGTYWNPLAYHLNSACEATGGSLDAWAVGISVAVEAVVSLIGVEGDEEKAGRLTILQDRMRRWFAEQSDFVDFSDRLNGLINAMSNKRPQDTLYALAGTGHVEKDYVKAWTYLRNKHVHPTTKDLNRPDPIDIQKLIDHIYRVEVLLRQVTFYLIGYEGPFTDYGVHGAGSFPAKQYPLKAVQ